MLLQAKNISIGLHSNTDTRLCSNLNFEINDGESVGILGESGSGKSITALSLMQLLPPALTITGGEILFTRKNGDEINLARACVREMQSIRGKEISMIFQEPMTSLNPVIPCGKQVREIVDEHEKFDSKHAYKYVLELFEKVKLPDPEKIYRSYPYQLSGGQKQRVMIAMAVACSPRLLIADEPTTALDVTVQKSILELLRELQKEYGMGILFITHDISVISEISQRVLVFYKGELVEEGLTRNILENPEHPYTKGLMSCRYSMNNKGKRLLTISDFMKAETEGEQQPDFVIPARPEIKTGDEPVFEVNNLVVSFQQPKRFLFEKTKHAEIIKKISFTIFQGETVGLVGESGSGKTTIGRALLKLIESNSGDIFFHGKPIQQLTHSEIKHFRRKVQIIFQDPYSSLNPKHTVGQILEEPLIVHKLCKNAKERRERVNQLLQQVNLDTSFYNRYPHQFSGGQRQRIGIARALAVQPELLVLDESVAALDVSIQAQVLNLLNDLKREYNLTYIFISHDLNIVKYMSDRMLVLKSGEIVEEGNAVEIFENPKNDYTRNLLNAIPGALGK